MNEDLKELFSRFYHKPPHSIGFIPEYVARTEQLLEFCIKHNIKSVYDAGCGELNWMNPERLRAGNIRYMGGDISIHSVAYCKSMWPELSISLHDMTSDPLPQVDLVFSSDVVIHLENMDKIRFLRNFVNSESRYLLVTNDRGAISNDPVDYKSEFPWAPVNWALAPWNFPPEIDCMPDLVPQPDYPTRVMSMWSLSQVKEAIDNIKSLT
jgi:SAM-dependent methyltransferase